MTWNSMLKVWLTFSEFVGLRGWKMEAGGLYYSFF